MVNKVHDQIIFIPKAEPVFAIINKLFIYIKRIKGTRFPALLFCYTQTRNYIDQAHINTRVLSYSVYDFACLNPTVFEKIQLDLNFDGVSTRQGVLYFPSASLYAF